MSKVPDYIRCRQGWSEWFVGALPYGPELRRSRQKLHQFLQKSVIPDYHKLQMQSAYKLAEQLLRQPESYVESSRIADTTTTIPNRRNTS